MTVNNKKENFEDICLDFVQECGFGAEQNRSALEALGSSGEYRIAQDRPGEHRKNQKSIGKPKTAQDSTREYRTAEASATAYGKDTTPKIRNKKELRGHSSHSYIHFSVNDLYIPTIGMP